MSSKAWLRPAAREGQRRSLKAAWRRAAAASAAAPSDEDAGGDTAAGSGCSGQGGAVGERMTIEPSGASSMLLSVCPVVCRSVVPSNSMM
jgi:hypothetical protein